MSSFDFFWGLGDFLEWTLTPYDWIGNVFNYGCIVLGFGGLFYWLNLQRKWDKEELNKS